MPLGIKWILTDGRSQNAFSCHQKKHCLVDAVFTKHQCNVIRMKDKERFPSYKQIQHAKQNSYSKKQYISVTDSTVLYKIARAINHTVLRLMRALHEMIKS